MATAPVLASVKDIAWSMPQAAAAFEAASGQPAPATAAVTADAVHVAFEAPQVSFNFEYPQAVAKTFEAPAAHAEAPDLGESLAKIVEDAQANNRQRALFGIQLGANSGRGNGGGHAAAKKQLPVPQQPSSAAAARPREAVTKARMEAYAQSHEIMREQMLARGTKNHPWALVYHTKDVQGTRGLLDAMELVVLKQGSLKMQMWLAEMSRNEDTAVALSAIFGSAAEAAADRLLGILLLTTDGQGGRESVSRTFQQMSTHVEGSLRFAHFLDTASKDPIGGRGLSELLDTLSAPQGDHEWGGATELAEIFKNVSFTVGGARRLNQTWQNLAEMEGGNVLVARLLQRMSRTSEGALATLETLHNLAHDNDGAGLLGRVLARVSESREGARDVLKALQAMSGKPAGQRELVRLLVRLAEGGELGRLLSTLSKDSLNAYALGNLLHLLSQSSGGRKLVRFAMERTAFGRQKSSYQMFVARMSRCEGMSIPGLDFAPSCAAVEFSVAEKAFF